MEAEYKINKYFTLVSIIWLIPINVTIYEIALNYEGIYLYSSYLFLPIVNAGIIVLIIKNLRFGLTSSLLLTISLFIPIIIIYRTLNQITLDSIGPIFLNIYSFTTWLIPFLSIIIVRYPDFIIQFFSISKKQIVLGLYIGLILLIAVYISDYKIRRYANALLYFSCGLSLIYFHFGLIKKYKTTLIGAALWMLISLVSNRREDLLYGILIMFGFFIFSGHENKKDSFLIRISIVIIISTLLVFSGNLLNFIPSLIPSKYQHTGYNYKEELFLDSRSVLKDDYWMDMQHDLLLGRGLTGKYTTPNFAPYYDERTGGRYSIEVGYLQIILKGGILSLLLYLCIIISSIYLGFFKTNNTLTKIFGYLLIVHMLLMFWARVPAVDPNYMLFWFLVGFNFSKNIRNLTNEEIHCILE